MKLTTKIFSSIGTFVLSLKAFCLACTPPSAAPPVSYQYSHQPRLSSYRSAGGFTSQQQQFLNGVPNEQQKQQFFDTGTTGSIWPDWQQNWNAGWQQQPNGDSQPNQMELDSNFLNGDNFPEEKEPDQSTTKVPVPNGQQKFLIIVPDAENATIDGERGKDERNDLLLAKQPTATTRQYSLQALPFKGQETGGKGKPKEVPKLDEPLQIAQNGAELIGESADAVFIPLDCPQSGVHNYSQLLNCLEVEIRPFDGFSFVERELPLPTLHQVCRFEESDPSEQCSFYSAEEQQLQLNLGRFCFPEISLQENPKQRASFAKLTQRPENDIPTGNFLVLIEPEGRDPRNSATLKLDIGCQQGDGTLTFNYWSTFGQFSLKVCTRESEERHCTPQILYLSDSSKVEVHVVNPSKSGFDRFSVEIIAGGFFEPAILILDNLLYEATPCSIENELDPSSNGTTGKIGKAKIFAPKAVAIPVELESNELERIDQKPVEKEVQLEKKKPLKKIEVKPSPIESEAEDYLESDSSEENELQPIAKEEFNKKFPMRVVNSGTIKAFVGNKFQREMLKLMGQPHWEERRKVVEGTVKIMPLKSTKKKLGPWEESNEETIENQKDDGKTKEIYDRIVALRKLRRLRLAKGRKRALSACELVECAFGNGFCHYSQVESGGKFRLGKWRIATPKSPNINIRSRKSLVKEFSMVNESLQYFGYAFIGTDLPRFSFDDASREKQEGMLIAQKMSRIIYILQSPEFKLDPVDDVQLNFDLYRRTNTIALQICLNSMMNCAYLAPQIDEAMPDHWQRGQKVHLPADTKRFFIVGTQRRGDQGWLAIDNIHLVLNGQSCEADQ